MNRTMALRPPPPPRSDAWLQSTYRLLACAFPEGLPESDYLPLLAALYADMADRSLAQAVEQTFETTSASVYNDVLHAGAGEGASLADVVRVKARLSRCGYEAWRREG